jgi:hypothetical protein
VIKNENEFDINFFECFKGAIILAILAVASARDISVLYEPDGSIVCYQRCSRAIENCPKVICPVEWQGPQMADEPAREEEKEEVKDEEKEDELTPFQFPGMMGPGMGMMGPGMGMMGPGMGMMGPGMGMMGPGMGMMGPGMMGPGMGGMGGMGMGQYPIDYSQSCNNNCNCGMTCVPWFPCGCRCPPPCDDRTTTARKNFN